MEREKVTVAIIDSGVDPKHPDPIANLVEGYDVVDHNQDTHDQTGHGIRMAGILGASINNTIGLAGVMDDPSHNTLTRSIMDLVKMIPISGGETAKFKTLIAAVDYFIKNQENVNIKIILLAISDRQFPKRFHDELKEADSAGLLVNVSSGNNGKDISIDKRVPCALTEELHGMICVAATDRSGLKLHDGSNYADYEDIAAPGEYIITTGNLGVYSCVTGTSAAAAIIAGVAAMRKVYSRKLPRWESSTRAAKLFLSDASMLRRL